MLLLRAWPRGLAAAVALAALGLADVPVRAQLTPTFRASTALFTIQVQVVARRGQPLPDLSTDHFDVVMGGRARVVRFAELVRIDGGWAGDTRAESQVQTGFIDAENFFRPFPNRASAQYLLGIEVPQPDRDLAVNVKLRQWNLQVRRWMWRTGPRSTSADATRY